MNWISEAQKSWEWLQWMRQVTSEDVKPIASLPQLIRGLDEWNATIAGDRHVTGDPDRISEKEGFVYAAAMMSREAKTAIEDALKHAITWNIDLPMTWSTLPPEAQENWADAERVIKNVLHAWITVWNDLAAFQGKTLGTAEQQLQQWKELAEQASQTIAGLSVAAWAQRRR